MVSASVTHNWPVRLFKRSVLKQRKFKEITALLDSTSHWRCLDIGGDNGVISLLLRERGGNWTSADLDEGSVCAIRELVKTQVYQINDRYTPFKNNEFDCVVIVDFLEHIVNDLGFMSELHRILKPEGTLIINVPHNKLSLLRKIRIAIGQTDEKHGHVRPGYTIDSLKGLLGESFRLEVHKTYSKFFSEMIDTLLVYGISLLKRNQHAYSKKGHLVTGKDMSAHQSLFAVYSLIYPLVWMVSKLDNLLFFTSGYMLIVRARTQKAAK